MYIRIIFILLIGLTATSCLENHKTKKTTRIKQQATSAQLSTETPKTQGKNDSAIAQKEIWSTLADSFRFKEEIHHPDVDKHVQKFLKNKLQLQKLIENSAPYLYYVLNEVKKRDLPGELALIPIVESAFNPFAQSHVGAVGLWQLMPATSTELGVTRDWWFDGRRDIHESTQASLQYFEYLNNFFKGDWSHAIAAYNAGQGRVRNAINKNQNSAKDTSYWSLPLPKETKDYVPKLYALAKIIQNPAQYDITLPAIPNEPYFKFVQLESSIELAKAAELAEMNFKEFQGLNSGHNQWLTKPEKAHKIAVPVHKISTFEQNLQKFSAQTTDLIKWQEHRVQKGESIQNIANTYKAPKELIKAVNQVSHNKVKPGATLWIPEPTVKSANSTTSISPLFKKVVHKKSNHKLKAKSMKKLKSTSIKAKQLRSIAA